jgi:hypothetical protein
MWKLELFYTRLERNKIFAVKDSLHPVYFEGNMSAEFIRDLVCSCKGKSQCKKSCVCAEQNLDRKHAKLWSGMKHEEYADEAPLLKVVI